MVLDLIEFYNKSRIDNTKDIYDLKYLENLDMKQLQFTVFYFFLTKAELPDEFRYSETLLLVVTSLVKSINDESLYEYYSKYFNLNEVDIQWKKIYNEIAIFEKRKEMLNGLDT